MNEKEQLSDRDREIWDLLKKVELETGYDSWGRLSKLVYPVPPPETRND